MAVVAIALLFAASVYFLISLFLIFLYSKSAVPTVQDGEKTPIGLIIYIINIYNKIFSPTFS